MLCLDLSLAHVPQDERYAYVALQRGPRPQPNVPPASIAQRRMRDEDSVVSAEAFLPPPGRAWGSSVRTREQAEALEAAMLGAT